jgi:hypothetical protein
MDCPFQKKIPEGCSDCQYADPSQKVGEHCAYDLRCYVCGRKIPFAYLDKVAKNVRENTRFGLCDKCLKRRNNVLDSEHAKRGRYLW